MEVGAKAVVTGSFDGKARLWSPVGKLLCELEGAEERVCSVSLAPPSAGADRGKRVRGVGGFGGSHRAIVRGDADWEKV